MQSVSEEDIDVFTIDDDEEEEDDEGEEGGGPTMQAV